ncbi:THAP domain-containing protein 9 [Plakobranchus ocellatus]|uniref:THAP domain-containing protein 9 n=1 Tax=Plakobranchus ocellatus TaxID=259542 RepID=A0AAV4A5M4_9GAST|nr:THAP domain-containing protein 9 [Plakobranchus ocellatus]
MTPNEKICALLLDEISIKPSLTYNPHQDLVEGFENFGHFERTNTASNSALVFMRNTATYSSTQAQKAQGFVFVFMSDHEKVISGFQASAKSDRLLRGSKE